LQRRVSNQSSSQLVARRRSPLWSFAPRFHAPTRAAFRFGFRDSTRVSLQYRRRQAGRLVPSITTPVSLDQGRCRGERDPDRQVFSDREREPQSEPERSRRSGHPRAILHVRDARAWQLALSMASVYGRGAASIAGTLTSVAGPIVSTRTGMLEGSLTCLRLRRCSRRQLQPDAARQYRPRRDRRRRLYLS
jgi:hypothetical protein